VPLNRSLAANRSAATVLFFALAAACGGRSLTREESTSNSRGGSGNAGAGNANSSGASSGASGNLGNVGSGATGNSAGLSGASGQSPQFACKAVASQQFDAAFMQPYAESKEVTEAVQATLSAMTSGEKATQLLGLPVGAFDFFDTSRTANTNISGGVTIRGFNFRDGARGVNLEAGQKNRSDDGKDFATVFPAPSLRAASWDLELEKRIGEAIGDETAASLNNVLFGPTMNIVRHPYWGRTQETYGEDMYYIGRMATAFTVGLQEYVLGCAKHFAANNIEKFRSSQDALMNEQTLREIYGRHFEMVVQDGGVGCIMASYNKINGIKSTQNKHLLRDILKAPVEQNGIGFRGFVLSDFAGMPGDQNIPDDTTAQQLTIEAVQAGLDIERPWTFHYSPTTLARADQALVEEAAKRVLTQKFRFKAATGSQWGLKQTTSTLTAGSIATSTAHEALSEEAALKSSVLLANGTASKRVLPLAGVGNIAVVGPDREFSLVSSSVPKSCSGSQRGPCTFHFATDPAFGDRGTSLVNGDPARAVGPFAGIQSAAGSATHVTSGNSAAAAAEADAVVVVVGYTPGDEGEEFPVPTGGDRSTLDLPEGQNAFVTSVLDLMKPTVIIIESGSIVNLPWLAHANKNQATVWAGYGGLRAGAALGKLIFGQANFSGKMPMAWPAQRELDRMQFKGADHTTTMGYFFGYREYDRRKAAGQAVDLVFPFGHGSSYSSFAYSNLVLPCQTATRDAIFNIAVDIQNTSAVDGDEIAMLFVKPPPKPAGVTGDRPLKELKSFARVAVKAGQRVTAQLPLRIRDLRRWEGDANGKWVLDSGAYAILVGKNAEDAETSGLSGTLQVEGY